MKRPGKSWEETPRAGISPHRTVRCGAEAAARDAARNDERTAAKHAAETRERPGSCETRPPSSPSDGHEPTVKAEPAGLMRHRRLKGLIHAERRL